MPCFHPLKAFRGRVAGASGKAPVVFKKEDSCGVELELPCGQCIGCRLERSRQWAVRCMHEASLHDDNCFITLTYNDESLPADGSLDVGVWQRFAKRMRKRCGPFRFFHCGEYGPKLLRPHYHACIFGFNFPDRVHFKTSGSGAKIDSSDILSALWPFGFSSVGDVTFESAAYVARYVVKKVTGDKAEDFYGDLRPEYVTMSRRPGIARHWFERFGNEVFPSDEVIVRGHPCKPPRFYDVLQEAAEPGVFDLVSRKRKDRARERAYDNSPERLAVREVCAKARLSRFKRAYEDEV